MLALLSFLSPPSLKEIHESKFMCRPPTFSSNTTHTLAQCRTVEEVGPPEKGVMCHLHQKITRVFQVAPGEHIVKSTTHPVNEGH